LDNVTQEHVEVVIEILAGKKPISKHYQYFRLSGKSQPVSPITVPMAWRHMIVLTHSEGKAYNYIPLINNEKPPSEKYMEYCAKKMRKTLKGFKEHTHPMSRIMATYSKKVIARRFKKGTITDLERYMHTEYNDILPLAIILASGKKNDPKIFLIVMKAMGLTLPVSGLRAVLNEEPWDATIPR
jgi:hypothetical protein